MKTLLNAGLICVMLFLLVTKAFGQNHAIQSDILKKVVSKSKVIHNDFRVIEKMFSEYIYQGDSIPSNRLFRHTFSLSKTYHITGIAPSEYLSDLDIVIYKYDANNKLQRILADNRVGNEVDLIFRPAETGDYFIVVDGKLRSGMDSAFFSIIVDRD